MCTQLVQKDAAMEAQVHTIETTTPDTDGEFTEVTSRMTVKTNTAEGRTAMQKNHNTN